MMSFTASLICSAVLIASTGTGGPEGRQASEQTTNDKRVVFQAEAVGKDAPIAISEIRVGSNIIKPGEPTSLGGNWLRDLVVVLKNTSNQPIIEGGVTVIFWAEPSSTGPSDATASFLGRYPREALFRSDGSEISAPQNTGAIPILVQPNESLRFTFSEYGAEEQERFRASTGEIHSAHLQIATIYFANGCRWGHGVFLAPGDSPGKWRQISYDEFSTYPNLKPR
jgi:hypothetical protein